MLTKKQKIWLWISGALFLIPELLWSPISNLYYQLTQTSKSGGTFPFRYNFLQNSDNLNYLKFVVLLQFLGVLITLILALKNRVIKNKVLKYFFIALLAILLLLTGFALLFVMTFTINIM